MIAKPTRSAVACARQRALHLEIDGEPKVFRDEFARPLIDGLPVPDTWDAHSASAKLGRAQFLTRFRYTEDALADACERGVVQYVILGAGLDTYAFRRHAAVAVFEVDRPEMLAWKRARIGELGWSMPEGVKFVDMDFEQDVLASRLGVAGFDPGAPTFVSWLGVTMYLTRDAIRATLESIASLSSSIDVVMTYCRPADSIDGIDRERAVSIIGALSEWGESYVTSLEPSEAAGLLGEAGFSVSLFGPSEAAAYYEGRSDGLRAELWEGIAHGRNAR